jgi:hypothetical protein
MTASVFNKSPGTNYHCLLIFICNNNCLKLTIKISNFQLFIAITEEKGQR